MERALGRPTFCWAGKDYPCTPGKGDELKVFAAGGFAPSDTLVLNVRNGVLPSPGPKPKEFLKFRGYRYQIDTVSGSPDGAWVKLMCLDPDR